MNGVYWSNAIKNSICVVAWVILAILCDKWWIALFGLLFISSVRPAHFVNRVCDRCGKHSEYAETRDKAIEKAKESGWVHYEDGDRDYCPECKGKV